MLYVGVSGVKCIPRLFYSQFMDRVVPVSTTRVAEMVKLLENTFRMINIGWLFRVLSGRRSQIEFPTVEVDGVDEVLLIAETARRGLDPLNP